MFCRSLFVLLYFFFLPLWCLFFFYMWNLIIFKLFLCRLKLHRYGTQWYFLLFIISSCIMLWIWESISNSPHLYLIAKYCNITSSYLQSILILKCMKLIFFLNSDGQQVHPWPIRGGFSRCIGPGSGETIWGLWISERPLSHRDFILIFSSFLGGIFNYF